MSEQVAYAKFKARLKNQYGLDLDLYKEAQISRRLQGYMQRHQLSDYADLERYVAATEKASHLIDYLDINVSEFFRNPELFSYLEQEVLPKLAQKGEAVRLWSAGCSIGAEPYSLAIALAEAKFRIAAQIWATDLDAGALQQAANGQYSLGDVRNVPPERIAKYFDVAGTAVTIKPQLKKGISFVKHDLLRDPIRDKFSLIVCRNVAIYFTEEAKTSMLHRFAGALHPGGILFTGATESYINYRDLGFKRLHTCFYEKAGE